jgi:putative Holliday junction resolvase
LRNLSIDFGTVRIGLALSDAGGKFATPLDVLQTDTPAQSIEKILRIINAEAVQRIVVGVPLNMDDTIGPSARAAINFGKDLSTRSAKPVIFVDERLSSFEAEQSLITRKRGGEKITRKQKKDRLDALAAASFLQAFLDGKIAALEME